MYGRAGLERFRKAQTLEPFSVASKSSHKQTTEPLVSSIHSQPSHQETLFKNRLHDPQKPVGPEVMVSSVILCLIIHLYHASMQQLFSQEWKFAGIYRTLYLACSIFVIDLGSVHGTFVANERLTKDNPVELEPGQSFRFAASTRTYILRKNIKALFPPPLKPAEINLPPPDPSNEEAVLAYNTALNRYGLAKLELSAKSSGNLESSFDRNDDRQGSRPAKKTRKLRVTFRDQVGGELSEVIGVSDGAHVETKPGPVGVKEGSHVGKYESLVEITVIPKEKEQGSSREKSITQKGVTDRLQEVLNKVKATPKSNAIYDDLYGESFSGKVGSSWAYATVPSGDGQGSSTKDGEFSHDSTGRSSTGHHDDDNDLFGD